MKIKLLNLQIQTFLLMLMKPQLQTLNQAPLTYLLKFLLILLHIYPAATLMKLAKIFKTFKDIKEMFQITKFLKCIKNIAKLSKKCSHPIEKMLIIINEFNTLANEFNIPHHD